MFKIYRELKGLTQLQLAELTNMDIRTIQRIENKENIPSLENFKKLVKVLNIPDKEILKYIKK